jgi:hypothetical protein
MNANTLLLEMKICGNQKEVLPTSISTWGIRITTNVVQFSFQKGPFVTKRKGVRPSNKLDDLMSLHGT